MLSPLTLEFSLVPPQVIALFMCYIKRYSFKCWSDSSILSTVPSRRYTGSTCVANVYKCAVLICSLSCWSRKIKYCFPLHTSFFFSLSLSFSLSAIFFSFPPPLLWRHIWFAHFRQNPCKVYTLSLLQMTSSVLVTRGSTVRSSSQALRVFQCFKGNSCITFILGLQLYKIIQKQQ